MSKLPPLICPLSYIKMNVNIDERVKIIFHFNKKYLEDSSIPMWVLKVKGQTYYIDSLVSEVGFSSKETPDSEHTKGSIKIWGRLEIKNREARIY